MKHFYFFLVTLFAINGTIAQWVPQNSGTTKNLNSIFFSEANTGYVVGDNGTILKTTDGGMHWSNQVSGTDSVLKSVCFPKVNTGYVVGYGGTILKTTNGGFNWESQSAVFLGNLNSVYFIDTVTGYAVGEAQHDDSAFLYILKTTNGGTQWSRINTHLFGSGSTLNSVYFTDSLTGYAVGVMPSQTSFPYAIILKTTDGGENWISRSGVLLSTTSHLNSVYFTDADTGYAVGGSIEFGWPNISTALILKTTNGGTDWNSQTSQPSTLTSVYFTDGNTGYAVGRGGTIIQTINGGTTWNTQLSGTTKGLYSVYFTNASIGYAIGDSGTILKTTNGGYPAGINDLSSKFNTLKVYPNPASITIAIETPTKGFLFIHSISGQQLLQQEITKPTTTINVSTLPNGIYVVKVVGETGVLVGKFIRQ